MKNYTKANAEIGARIQEIRMKRNMTQEVLAEKAGICNAQQMSNIERGLAGLSVPRLKDVCKVLNIEADYILFGNTGKGAETVLHKYIEKMTPEQVNNLVELVKVYSKTCGIEIL
ncbi:MAG: helix-turn-helix transcriptional regulator [Clostridia bacterium]|nr:helix-turn-helix transcriptional regulator [Clostridia bacterium]